MTKLLVCGVSDFNVPALDAAARHIGVEPVFIFARDKYPASTLADLLQTSFILESESAGALDIARQIQAKHPVLGVVSTDDATISTSIELARDLRVKSISLGVAKANNKMLLANSLSRLCPKTIEVSSDAAYKLDLDAFFGGRPYLFKPHEGTDGTGVILEAQAHVGSGGSIGSDIMMAQERLTGRNIFVDGIVSGGEIIFFGAGEVARSYAATETQFDYPVTNTLREGIYAQMCKAISEVIYYFDIETSPFHVQFILPDKGDPAIIDPNFGRFGGNLVSLMIARQLGMRHEDLYACYLKAIFLGQIDNRLRSAPHSPTLSAVCFGVPDNCFVYDAELAAEERQEWFGIRSIPEYVPSLRNSNQGWIATVLCTKSDVDAVMGGIRLDTSIGTIAPAY